MLIIYHYIWLAVLLRREDCIQFINEDILHMLLHMLFYFLKTINRHHECQMEVIMDKKSKYIKDLVIGETCINETFCLRKIYKQQDEIQYFNLTDNSGEIGAYCSVNAIGATKFAEGMAVIVSGTVKAENGKKILSIESIDLCTDLSKEKILECKKGIRTLMTKISHTGYRRLLEVCLSDVVLDRMAQLPATLSGYGKYNGATLVATNTVSHMALTTMTAYSNRCIATIPPAWNALTTASLLFLYGNIKYFDSVPPYHKTKMGVMMGYTALLQGMLQDAIHEHNIEISDDDFATLMNILKVTTEDKTAVRATSREGAVLRHTLSLYMDCDLFDWDVTNHEKSDTNEQYFYSSTLKTYIVP